MVTAWAAAERLEEKMNRDVARGWGSILLTYETIMTGSVSNILDRHCAVVLDKNEKANG